MSTRTKKRIRTWQGWINITIVVVFSISMLASQNLGLRGFNSASGFIVTSDNITIWDPTILPSALSYTMEETFPGLTEKDEVDVSTSLPVIATSMEVENLTVNSISKVIEAVSINFTQSSDTVGLLVFQQIKVPASCYVQWVSIFVEYIRLSDLTPLYLNVSLYNATQGFPSLAPTPHEMVAGSSASVDPRLGTTGTEMYMGHWENVTLGNVLLDSSNTLYQGGYYHFFVSVLLPPETGYLWWYSSDTEGLADDDGLAYVSITDPVDPTIRLPTIEVPGVDLTCITRLYPVDPAPSPSSIGMVVNGEPVSDIGSGKGNYTSSEPLTPTNNIVTYDVASAWSNYPGGSMSYDLDLNYTVEGIITPVLVNAIDMAVNTVTWNATYIFTPTHIQGKATASLSVRVPNSWASVAVYNITDGGQVPIAALLVPGTTGKYQQLTTAGLTPGSWLITAQSNILNPTVLLDLMDGAIDLGGSLTGTIQVMGGPNGKLANLRSDLEGGISAITMQSGTASSTMPGAVLWSDGRWIQFSNETAIGLKHIIDKLSAFELTETSSINSTFDLFLDLPEGFSEANLHDIKFLIDHECFAKSWWWANVTGAAVPENPFTWYLSSVPLSQVFNYTLQQDLRYLLLNLTYNNTPGVKRFSDAFLNYSLNVFDQLAVNRSLITSISFDLVTNFTAPLYDQQIYIKNQSNPTPQWVQLTNVVQLPSLSVFRHLQWNSIGEGAISNITQFINPVGNTVEMRVRSYNQSIAVPTGPTAEHHIVVDQAAINFTYANTFKSLDLQVYNWTAGVYCDTVVQFSPGEGTTNTSISLQPSFPAGLTGIIDPPTGKIRIRIGAEALIPLVNTVWWKLDRMLVNVTFTDYVRCSWNQTVFNDAGNPIHSVAQETLFDSPNNNLTISLPVREIIDFCDDYNYTVVWSNGSDLMYARLPFSINRHSTTLSVISGIDGDYKVAGSVIQVVVKVKYSENDTGIINVPVQVVLYVKNDAGISQIIPVNGMTGSDGIASVGIQFLDGWQSLTYSVIFTSLDPAFKDSSLVSTSEVPIYNDLEFIGYLVGSYWYIIVSAIIIILVGTFAKRGSDAKKKRQWKGDANRIRDVVKIQHLMVIMKDSGMCLVNRSYSQMQFDGDLVSGFLHAIATFGKEVGVDRGAPAKKSGGDAIVFDYQDFKILISEGRQVRLALILNGPPTEGLKERAKQFISTFEASYDMQNWRGSLDVFSGVDSFVEQAFEITLLYPLVVNTKKAKKEIKSGLGKVLYEVGEAVQKEKQAFYLATLLNFAQAGRKESQDQVLGEIYQLKKQGFLTFYNPQVTQST